MTRHTYAGLLAFVALLLLAALLTAAPPAQAPAPPQAPSLPEFACDCGAAGCHRYADGGCHCGPQTRAGGRGVDCPLSAVRKPSARPDGLGYCSPACRCGCQEGAPCVCGGYMAPGPSFVPFAPQTRTYAFPAGFYAPPGDGGCAGGNCGAPAGRGLFRRR
jgi:hypothetical protein